MFTVLTADGAPFLRQVELRASRGVYLVEKITDAKGPTLYGRTLTYGKSDEPDYKTTKANCDAAEAASLTDNIEPMLTFKK